MLIITFILITVSVLVGVVAYKLSMQNKECTLRVVPPNVAEEDVYDKKVISVDVSGAVVHPGVYNLPETSRVGDALHLSGGYSPAASLKWITKNINLSKFLTDQEKIYIPFEWDTPLEITPSYLLDDAEYSWDIPTSEQPQKSGTASNTSGESTSSKINVNTASLDDLDTLPGIGATYAAKIVANRPYTNLSDFEKKSGISANSVSKIKDLIVF